MYDETLERKELFSRTVVLGFTPEWVANSEGWPGGHTVYKGKQFGVDWSGRIDLWTKNNHLPKEGDVVIFKEMEVLKRVARRREIRQSRQNGRIVSCLRQISMDDGLAVSEDNRRYFILQAAPE